MQPETRGGARFASAHRVREPAPPEQSAYW
jgi:hypothetical protein